MNRMGLSLENLLLQSDGRFISLQHDELYHVSFLFN